MGFVESIGSVIGNTFNFNGRASRSEYWYWSLFLAIALMVISLFIILTVTGAQDQQTSKEILLSSSMILLLLLALAFIPSLAVTVRRLHDTGHSGWWYFISIVPYIGVFILLYLTVLPSQPGGNKWGGNPSGDNGTSGLKDIYDSVAGNASIEAAISQKLGNVMDSSVVNKIASRQQRPAMSGTAVTFGKR